VRNSTENTREIAVDELLGYRVVGRVDEYGLAL
jgi:hypothetical protein